MRKMKARMWVLVFAVLMGLVSFARAGDAVEPASFALTNNRADSVEFANDIYYYTGSTLLLTNNWMQTTGVQTQGLDDVTITVTVGRPSTNISYTGEAISTNGGTWWVSFPVPTDVVGDLFNVQVSITDLQTNTYTYAWKKFHTRTAM